MLEFEGRQIPNRLNEVVDPKHRVLLVWDMQNDQAGGSFNKEALIRNAPPLIAAAAKAGVKTVYTRQTPFLWKEEARLDSPRHEGSKGRSSKPAQTTTAERQHRLEDHEAVQTGANDIVIDKRRPSMFIGNEFETIMHNRGATTVVMIGCTTDGGVEMTVRDGHNRGYSMVIVRDCVGTYTEEGHNAALKRIERFADVVESKS